jgi:hypothetical protein
MAKKYQTFDTATKQISWSPAPAGSAPVDQDFDVGAGGQTNFTVTVTFDANTKIDVLVDGRKKREGASYDFTRNVALNRIEFTAVVPQNSWVQVRTY